MQHLLYNALRVTRDILVRLQALCWFVGLPLGLALWIIGGMLDLLGVKSEFLDDCILFGLIGAVVSFLFAAAAIKLRPLLEQRMAAHLPIRRGTANTESPDILYLRPFHMDRFTADEFVNFEEVLLRQLKMPVIAVSDAASSLEEPSLGALRIRLETNQVKSDWRVQVKKMIRAAKLVLIVFGDSPGLLAEIAIAQELHALSKIAIVVKSSTYASWAVLLQMLPDEVIHECIRSLPPSTSTRSDLSRILSATQMTSAKRLSQSPQMMNRFRESVPRAQAQSAKSSGNDPAIALRLLVDAKCPVEVLLLIHSLVSENVSGITFAPHFRLWKKRRRPPPVPIMGGQTSLFSLLLDLIGLYKRWFVDNRQGLDEARDLGLMVANMVEYLSAPASVPSNPSQ